LDDVNLYRYTNHFVYFLLYYFIGHYCPNGTEYGTQYPCPAGTYNPSTQRTSVTECIDCPGGEYCEGVGNSAPTGNCTAGWYCSGGSDSPNTTTHGGKCQPGYYCPERKFIIIS